MKNKILLYNLYYILILYIKNILINQFLIKRNINISLDDKKDNEQFLLFKREKR